MTDRAFHDAVLKENSIPIEMIRASLTGQRLDARYTPGLEVRRAAARQGMSPFRSAA